MKQLITFGLVITSSFLSFSQETIRKPDIGLEEALIDLDIDSNGLTGDILVSDAAYVVNLNVNDPLNNKKLPNVNSKIKSLSGIEHFPNLTRLDCYGNEITKLDLSKNTKLTFLNCSENKIETLDLSYNPNLVSVSCDNNKLTALKLGKQTNLRDLYCNSNYIRTLDIKGCTVLENLDASNNKIKDIIIDKTIYDQFSEGWYKDNNAIFTESSNSSPVSNTSTNTSEANNTPEPQVKETPTPVVTKTTTNVPAKESTANYYEKFQQSVVAEYDKLAFASDYLKSKKDILVKKYDLDPNKLNSWITKYANLNKTQLSVTPDKNSTIFHAKFKQATVDEYEKSVLNKAYLESKKKAIEEKYNINAGDLNKWISNLGNPALKARTEAPKENATNFYDKFKQSVVKEYENLVLNPDHFKTIKAQIQKKYNITATQLSQWIKRYSSTNN